MAYNGYGELGSWAGDLVQLTKNIKDRQPTDAEVEDLATDLLCGKSQFTSEEMVADIDAINIAAVLKEEEIPVSQAIDEYYMTLKGSDQTERYRLFVKNQFELDYVSKEKLIRETSKIMKEDVLIDILFDNYNISLNNPSDTIHVDAAINAFAEYIFKNCPEEMIVEDSFFHQILNPIRRTMFLVPVLDLRTVPVVLATAVEEEAVRITRTYQKAVLE